MDAKQAADGLPGWLWPLLTLLGIPLALKLVDWWRERRPQKQHEMQGLVSEQTDFMTALIEAAKLYPAAASENADLRAKLNLALDDNAQIKASNILLKAENDVLRQRNDALMQRFADVERRLTVIERERDDLRVALRDRDRELAEARRIAPANNSPLVVVNTTEGKERMGNGHDG